MFSNVQWSNRRWRKAARRYRLCLVDRLTGYHVGNEGMVFNSADIYLLFIFIVRFLKIKIMLESSQELQTRNILNANQFNSVRKIGKGGFGHVLLATKATSSSTFYAIKCLSKKKMIKDPQLKKSLIQEINTMAALNHSNIVKLYKTFEEGDWYFLVMEYCDMGNLYSIQSKLTNKVFSLDEALNIFNQIIKGVQIIHRNKIVHRDLKLQNIFVRKTDKSALVCKIGDFGLARFLEMTAHSNCGTQNYMAPQILQYVPYGQQVDIWSMGVLFFYLLFGEFPFKGINILDDIYSKCKGGFRLSQNIKNKNYFRSKKQQNYLCDLFMKIFEMNTSKRICISILKQHPALKGKYSQEESTTEQDNVNQFAINIQWEINQMRFIQKISRQIETSNFISNYLMLGFKFYINKVLLYFINKDNIRNYRKDKQGHPKLLKTLVEMQSDIQGKLEKILTQIKQAIQPKETIPNFDQGLTSKYQDFQKFKMGYRNTIGRVYEQVHRKYPDNTYERASLKLKVFLCHIINRVFVGGLNEKLFPYFVGWMKKGGGKIGKNYDFRLIEEWIDSESIQNLNSSQEIINSTFYK